MFLKAARHGELDPMRGVSANVMCGQEGLFGTNMFQTMIDIDEMMKLDESKEWQQSDVQNEIEAAFGDLEDSTDACAMENIAVANNIMDIKGADFGDESDSDYDPGF
jgi:DNA-directed RNA polymerase II subunit RPB1